MKRAVSYYRIFIRSVKYVRAALMLFRLLVWLKLCELSIEINVNIMTKEKFNKIVNVVCALISALGAAISTLLN